MPAIHEIATITSKGQITLPKPIRQALGVEFGSQVAFELLGSQVLVTRVDHQHHEDPAIAGFLALLEKEISSGQRITSLPPELASSMLSAIRHPIDTRQEIVGDVAL